MGAMDAVAARAHRGQYGAVGGPSLRDMDHCQSRVLLDNQVPGLAPDEDFIAST
jgi:hypothetical protein